MPKSIYVGNIAFSTSEDDIRNLFSQFGEVNSVKFISDRETGRFRGFGFVEMDDNAAREAVQALNGKEVGGRALKVNEAQERESRPPRQY
ncbi:MAG: RNA-binding protein [Desulfovibrionales bacterium GWA2_65_9]|jgi:RNA recognition motif-containing protein|nr:RNA-binding protein [Pseudomonadota bacterium]MDO9633392.1 RNA-binding protein [Humidesulfovibrio sp.]MDP3427291.1 RNA-binding protein [Humidesulfovibrio sp.]OGR39577.1 MAG: RNA-binding protein [Desulfovibrionales bacterium GWA2_65_9]PKN09689.1 MAG: RNA-binding protein [Deltaproteobacteria bacterium HGW-Deltaproteobacteria-8]